VANDKDFTLGEVCFDECGGCPIDSDYSTVSIGIVEGILKKLKNISMQMRLYWMQPSLYNLQTRCHSVALIILSTDYSNFNTATFLNIMATVMETWPYLLTVDNVTQDTDELDIYFTVYGTSENTSSSRVALLISKLQDGDSFLSSSFEIADIQVGSDFYYPQKAGKNGSRQRTKYCRCGANETSKKLRWFDRCGCRRIHCLCGYLGGHFSAFEITKKEKTCSSTVKLDLFHIFYDKFSERS
jgi:hypothetical protein